MVARLSPTQSLLKSTRAMRGTCGGRTRANCKTVSAVSPRKQAMAAWATVPPPAPPHQSPCSSVETELLMACPEVWLNNWTARW